MPSDLTATPTEPHSLTIADAARLIESRRLSPVELTDTLLERIEALDPQLNAFLLPTPEKAREQARAAEREIMAGNYRGPLHGIPFGLKDIYATAGIRTTSHSKLREPCPNRRRDDGLEAVPGRRGAARQARDP
jgi:aspartyl-tRNA(Asn)/glutamyl-tRNA(Gln) amidotransferase subunit A